METLENDIRRALRQVYDPEIMVNIVDLGMIYAINVDDQGNALITMTFTAPNCPMADVVIDQAREVANEVPGIKKADIQITFEPPWDPSMMSEEALLETGLTGMY